MEAFQYILLALILIAAFPLGFLLAKMTKEELKSGRIWFKLVIALAIIISIVSIFFRLYFDEIVITVTSMLFIIIIAAISLLKSKKK